MRYLITGANGFLAKELKDYWAATDIELITITRQQVDLTDSVAVKDYFANNKFDVVVHTAVRGGRRGDPNSIQQLFDNLKMFDNQLKNNQWISGDFFSICDISLFCMLDFGLQNKQPFDPNLLELNVWYSTMMTLTSTHESKENLEA